MAEDHWAPLADAFVDGAYASVKGRVRTYVLHRQLLRHLPSPPVAVLDVGGGAAHQSLPLARLGHDVTVLDSSPAMLSRAEERLRGEPEEVRRRVRLVEGAGEQADVLTGGRRFAAVLCHGVLLYQQDPRPMVDAVCRCTGPGGVVSLMALNARTLAVRPALERRWADALAAFDAATEVGVLGAETRGDTVEGLSALLRDGGVEVEGWYGVWLFSDWMELPLGTTDVAAVAEVELRAASQDPYRQLSRAFHLVGRRAGA
ncbi:methyltransferase domain-containing protein [Pseudonocardia kujensis]|uniref:methyltransferase n=1 Tax=Pseudonocardia kujensis TaxID=1128675 RepID=UPI001E5867F0|nr:methyltransferase [Pseudonocardia kujensis]MCE0765780.1 methyltransferase domain-containing protein [Pseudonocardia kujensis]